MTMQINPERLEANWLAIDAALDVPAASRLERTLTRIGVPEPTARLLLSAPTLRRSWWIAVGIAMFVALAVDGNNASSAAGFVLLAPLVPLAGVAMAYGPASDPSYEAGLATPMSGMRLLLVRALGVLSVTAPFVALTGLALRSASWLAVAWLLPGIALALITIALGTRWSLRRSAALAGGLWMLTILTANARMDTIERLLGPGGQLLAVSFSGAAALVIYLRRTAYDRLATQ